MPDYKNPIDGSEYRDKQHVETALYEYRSMYVGKQYDVKGGGIIQALFPKFTTMYMAMKNNFLSLQISINDCAFASFGKIA